MEPWYRLVTPRREVREGRSFNPDEFAIALEQVVAGSAPDTTTRSPSRFSHGPVSHARCRTTRASNFSRCRFIFSGKNDELTPDFTRMMN